MKINALKQTKWFVGFLEQLSKNLNQFFWIYDIRSRKIIYLSRSFAHVIGKDFATLANSPDSFRSLIYHEDFKTLENLITGQNTGLISDFEYRIVGHDDAVRWISPQIIPFYLKCEHIWTIVFSRDVTEKKTVSTKVHEIEKLFRTFLKTSSSKSEGSELNKNVLLDAFKKGPINKGNPGAEYP